MTAPTRPARRRKGREVWLTIAQIGSSEAVAGGMTGVCNLKTCACKRGRILFREVLPRAGKKRAKR